jgi:hypothetical protein
MAMIFEFDSSMLTIYGWSRSQEFKCCEHYSLLSVTSTQLRNGKELTKSRLDE